jgi:hypothetical protein
MKLRLYLLTQSECSGYDTYDSCVVAAKSAEAAVMMHPYGTGPLGSARCGGSGEWPTDPKKVTAELIGVAEATQTPGVICASFNAG